MPDTSREAFVRGLKDRIEQKHGKAPEELFKEREKRLYDAVQLKVPDRVPVVFGGTFFACRYGNLPYSAAYYDAPAWRNAYAEMLVELEPDGYGVAAGESGPELELLDSNYQKWPGGNLPPDVAQQVNEQEFMKEDEYDLFITDPSDFILRYWLPRVYNSMSPLARLPSLMGSTFTVRGMTALFASQEFQDFAATMKKAGEAELAWRDQMAGFGEELAALGFPQALPIRGGVQPPFSSFTNSFRTFKGAVMDMFRRPDKLKAALAAMLEHHIARAQPAVREPGKPAIGMSGEAHRVSDDILSPKQFEEFVWPNWKRAMEATFALGFDVVEMFFEGRRDKQLEYFTDFPKGSQLIRFAETDIFRAKQILGDRACLMGNVPIAMLQIGSPSEVEDYVRKLITVVGRNGGFILRCSTDFTQDARLQNVKAMIDTVKKYGRY